MLTSFLNGSFKMLLHSISFFTLYLLLTEQEWRQYCAKCWNNDQFCNWKMAIINYTKINVRFHIVQCYFFRDWKSFGTWCSAMLLLNNLESQNIVQYWFIQTKPSLKQGHIYGALNLTFNALYIKYIFIVLWAVECIY